MCSSQAHLCPMCKGKGKAYNQMKTALTKQYLTNLKLKGVSGSQWLKKKGKAYP